MAILVDFRIPPVQDPAVVKWKRSLASLHPLAAATVHCIGWRFRRMWPYQVTWPDTGDLGYFNVFAGGNHTHRIRVRPSPICAHLFVVMVYQAPDEMSGGSQIELNLITVAGVTKDGPIVWDSNEGTLPTRQLDENEGFGGGVEECPYLTTHTGVTENPPLVETPRMIVVPTDARNVECFVSIETTNCRLRSATVWEWPSQVL